MLSRKRVRLFTGFLFLCIAVYSLILIYKSQDRYRNTFRSNMELSFSEITGSNVSIERVSGNPFRKIFFKGMLFDFGKYKLDFDRASLEYSLFDVLSDKAPKSGIKETVLSLTGGSLIFEDGLVLSNKINGKIKLRQGAVVLDSICFTVFDRFAGTLDGEIANNTSPSRVKIGISAASAFDKEDFIFKSLKVLATGPLDNLTIVGKIERRNARDIHLRIYSILNEGLFTIGTRLGIETETADINHVMSADTVVDPDKWEFNSVLMPNTGKVLVKGQYDNKGSVSVEFKNQQLKLFGQDFSNNTYVDVKPVIKGNAVSHFLADIRTEASVVNYYPVSEIEASFIVDPGRVRIVYAKLGDSVSASGFFNTKPPKRLVLNVNFSDFVLDNFLNLMIEDRPDVSGVISGRIEIEGVYNEPTAKVALSAVNGNLGDVIYDKMFINAQGIWPNLSMTDSRINFKNSSLNIEGELDMRRFGTGYFMEDITVSTTDNTVVWEGWDITRIDESREFLLQRSLGSGIRMGYKTHVTDETKYEPVKQRDEFQLEYDLLDEESVIEFRAKESEEFLGVKKRYKF
jgi:hypothetical protein